VLHYITNWPHSVCTTMKPIGHYDL